MLPAEGAGEDEARQEQEDELLRIAKEGEPRHHPPEETVERVVAPEGGGCGVPAVVKLEIGPACFIRAIVFETTFQ